jgi:hypothetical protein
MNLLLSAKPIIVRPPLKRANQLLALEQRFMFDGAAAADAAHAAGDTAVLARVADVAAAVVVREADPGKDSGKKEAVIVDTSVADYKTLEAGVKDGVAIIEIDGHQDGLAQIAKWAESQSGYDAIHILSHGSEGMLHLGAVTLTDASLTSELAQAELAEIGHALNAGGDLLLYGCDVAAGSDGTQFVADLAVATGADVAASTDATGASSRGGDWILESSTGSIEADKALTDTGTAQYAELLSTVTFTEGSAEDNAITGGATSFTRTIDGATFTFANGSTAYGPNYFDIALDSTSGLTGIYANSSRNGTNGVDLTVSVQSGYTFDLTGFVTSATTGVVTVYYNGMISSQTFTLSGADSINTLSSLTTFNDVTSVTFTSEGYALFQNLVISDVKPLAPSFTSGTTASFAENGTGTAYTAAATASGGTVSYGLSGTDAGLFNINSSTGVVTFKTAPNYEAPADSGANNVYDITITATDSNGSANQSVAITVTDVNEFSPTLATPTAASYIDTSANDTLFTNDTGYLVGSDQDGGATLTYGISGGTVASGSSTLAGNFGTLSVNTSTGAYTYTPDASAINGPTSGTSETFTVTTSDGTTSASATYTVNITGANDTPTLTTPTAASYTDTSVNNSFGNDTGTLTGSDRDTGQTLSYGISGGTVASGSSTLAGNFGTLSVNTSTGVYTYTPDAVAINGLTSSTSDAFTVTVSDGAGGSNTATYTVNITGANDTPTLTTPTAASYTDTAVNNSFGNDTGTLTGSDRDTGTTLTYGISGGTVASGSSTLVGNFGTLSVNTSTGAYTYTPDAVAINALTSGNSDSFTVTTSDGTASANATYTVNITGANDTPSNIALSGSSVGQSGGTNATVGTFSTTDADSGQTYTYSLVTGNGTNDHDNGSFNISGSTLRANNASSLAVGTYNIHVRTTDSGSATYDKAFTVTVSDDVAPTVGSVAVPSNATYRSGQNLDLTVTFSEAVTVDTTGGTPRIALTLGSGTVYANYLSGSGTTALVFRYTVQDGDNDTNGIAVGALALNGGTLKDAANNAATLTLNSVGNTTGVLVDTTAPSAPTLAISSDVGTSGSDGVTKTTAQTITVSGELGATVDLDFGDGSPHATGTIGGGGTFTTSSHTYAAGRYTISATLTDTGGNTSTAGTQTIVIDTTAPSVTTSASQAISTAAATNGATACTLAATDATAITGFTDARTWSITGGADAGKFSISGASLLINNAGGLGLGDYVVQVTATDTAGNTSAQTITVSVVNGPTVTSISQSYTDTAANDSFANKTGTISATANSGSITGYGINGGTTGGSTNIGGTVYDVSRAGTYGTLYVKSSDGSYAYVPTSDAALNATTATVTDTFTVQATDSGGTAGNTLTVTIGGVNDTPTLATPTAAAYTDTTAVDPFGNTTGTLAGSDRDTGASLSYGIVGGTSGSNTIGGTVYNISRAGTYGTLYVQSSGGAYVYVPNAGAINGLSTNSSDSFTVTTSDGSASANATYTVNLTAGNDAPTIGTSTTLTVGEGGSATITTAQLSISDIDTTAANLLLTVGTAPAHGTLRLNGGALSSGGTFTQDDLANNRVTYTHDGTESASDSFSFTTSDGTSTLASATFNIAVTAVNDAPTITAPTSIGIAGAAPTITGISVGDVDAGSGTVTLTFGAASGSLTATSGGGVSVNGSGTATMTLTGSIANINAFIAGAGVAFENTAHSTTNIALTVGVNDGGNTGSGGAKSATASIALTPNQAPTAIDGTLSVAGNGQFVFAASDFHFSDTDAGDSLQQVTIVTLPDSGTLTLNGVAVTAGQTISAADLAAGRLVFTPATNANAQTSFTFRVGDGKSDSVASYTETVVVTAVNDIPVVPTPTTPVAEPPPPVVVVVDSPAVTPPTTSFLPPASELSSPTVGVTDTVGTPSNPTTVTPVHTEAPRPTSSPSTSVNNGGFAVMVTTHPTLGGVDQLMVNHGIADSVVPAAGRVEVQVPSNTFAHTNPEAIVRLDARLADGRPLPPWVSFDSRTGKFVIQAPPGVAGQLTIRLIARDTDGREVGTVFRIRVGNNGGRAQMDVPNGKGLSEQIRLAARPYPAIDHLDAPFGNRSTLHRPLA